MKIITPFILFFFTLNAFPDETWRCSNRIPFFSDILIKIGARSTLLTMSTPTIDLGQAKIDLQKSIDIINKFKAAQNSSPQRALLTFTPVIVKEKDNYLVILDECLTPIEAASLYVSIENQGVKPVLVDIKNVSYKKAPLENDSTCNFQLLPDFFK